MTCPRQIDAVAIIEKAQKELIELGYRVTVLENIEQATEPKSDKTIFDVTYSITVKKRGFVNNEFALRKCHKSSSTISSGGQTPSISGDSSGDSDSSPK